jgi:hypothetical protein
LSPPPRREPEGRSSKLSLWLKGADAGLPKSDISSGRTEELSDDGSKAVWTGRWPGRRRRNSLPVREVAVKQSHTVPNYSLLSTLRVGEFRLTFPGRRTVTGPEDVVMVVTYDRRLSDLISKEK